MITLSIFAFIVMILVSLGDHRPKPTLSYGFPIPPRVTFLEVLGYIILTCIALSSIFFICLCWLGSLIGAPQ